jgi:hypothetical protein
MLLSDLFLEKLVYFEIFKSDYFEERFITTYLFAIRGAVAVC